METYSSHQKRSLWWARLWANQFPWLGHTHSSWPSLGGHGFVATARKEKQVQLPVLLAPWSSRL